MKKLISLGTASMATKDQVVCALASDQTATAGVSCGPLNNRAICFGTAANPKGEGSLAVADVFGECP